MRLGWESRHVLSLLALAVILVSISILFQMANTARVTTDRARTEALLVNDTIFRLVKVVVESNPEDPFGAIARDQQLDSVIGSGLAHAPSVLHVAVCDLNGRAIAHALPEKQGEIMEDGAELEVPESLIDAIQLVWNLRNATGNYQFVTALDQGGDPFLTIRSDVSRTLLWDEVEAVFQRGAVAAAVIVLLAVGLGVYLGRAVTGGVRALEASVAALRKGEYEGIPERSNDVFGSLARELNLLRDRVQMEPRVLANMGELAAGMAHEIHQPIQAIKFELENLKYSREMGADEVDTHVASAKHAVERLHRSVEGFLTVVRLRPMSVDSVDTNDLMRDIRETLEVSANLNGLELDLDLADLVEETYADAQVIRQAVENLVKNAIQATPSREGRVTLRTAQANGEISIFVRDTGPGIERETLDKIFRLYYTTKPGGTGVGLALVRQAMEIHGGSVEIDSEPGEGTTVQLRIPVRSSPANGS